MPHAQLAAALRSWRQAVARDYPLEIGRTLLRAPTPEESDHIAHVKALAGGSL